MDQDTYGQNSEGTQHVIISSNSFAIKHAYNIVCDLFTTCRMKEQSVVKRGGIYGPRVYLDYTIDGVL